MSAKMDANAGQLSEFGDWGDTFDEDVEVKIAGLDRERGNSGQYEGPGISPTQEGVIIGACTREEAINGERDHSEKDGK